MTHGMSDPPTERLPYTAGSIEIDKLPEFFRHMRLNVQGMTLKETATAAGISFSFLSDIERGRTAPSLKTIRKLATALNAQFKIGVRP